MIAISEDRELANGRAHAREAQGQADSGAACGALAQGVVLRRDLGG